MKNKFTRNSIEVIAQLKEIIYHKNYLLLLLLLLLILS
jgi:hypothetical protein